MRLPRCCASASPRSSTPTKAPSSPARRSPTGALNRRTLLHGRQRPPFGQHLHRSAVEVAEVRHFPLTDHVQHSIQLVQGTRLLQLVKFHGHCDDDLACCPDRPILACPNTPDWSCNSRIRLAETRPGPATSRRQRIKEHGNPRARYLSRRAAASAAWRQEKEHVAVDPFGPPPAARIATRAECNPCALGTARICTDSARTNLSLHRLENARRLRYYPRLDN